MSRLSDDIAFWSTVVIRPGDTEPQRAFTYAVGGVVAGTKGVKASEVETCLGVQGRLPVLPFRIDRLTISIPKRTMSVYTGVASVDVTPTDVRSIVESMRAELFRLRMSEPSADSALVVSPGRVRPWRADVVVGAAYFREVVLDRPVVVGESDLVWVTVKFDKPLRLTASGVVLRFFVHGREAVAALGDAVEYVGVR